MIRKKQSQIDKLTFDNVFEDFVKHYPRLSKSVIHWFACGVGQIKIITVDDLELIYDYDSHQAIVSSNVN